MKLKIWVQSKTAFLFLLCSIFSQNSLAAAKKPYHIIASCGTEVHVFDAQLQECAHYQESLKQLTVYHAQHCKNDLLEKHIFTISLPRAWRITPDGQYLFGVEPESEAILQVSLQNPKEQARFFLAHYRQLLQVLSPQKWVILEHTNKYYTISLYNPQTEDIQSLYQSRIPVDHAYFDPKTMQLCLFSFWENAEYTDIAHQFYTMHLVNQILTINKRTNQTQRRLGGYPTFNALERKIVYFNKGQAMLYDMRNRKFRTLPLKFTPSYTPKGDWPCAPKVLILPNATFVVWERTNDGFYQLILYNTDGTLNKILLHRQSGPIHLQLVEALPRAFFVGDNSK